VAIAIIYGSNGGATEGVAKMIKDKLALEVDLLDIGRIKMDKLSEYSHLILGTSTWGEGELQDDWDDAFDEFQSVEFGGKTVAFFGLGDQEGYSENFLDGMGLLHGVALTNGASIVGDGLSSDSYDFDESLAVKNDTFVGLAIDEDNQDELTQERVDAWVEIIRPYFT
jgi:flavodoxin I